MKNRYPQAKQYSQRRTTLQSVPTFTGEPLERKIRRMVHNGEPLSEGTPLIYTERDRGVLPEYNIRTDRWEIATDITDKASKAKAVQREGKGKVIDLNEAKDVNEPKTGETEG